jgi:hypothetical protein
MTKEEILKEFWLLPAAERAAAAEQILKTKGRLDGNSSTSDNETRKHSLEEKLAAFHRLQGMLKTDPPPPTDEELKEDYINYLAEKYS